MVSILEPTRERAEAHLRDLPAGAAFVEIRADALGPDDVSALVRAAPTPAIVAVRAPADGGSFVGPPERKRTILRAALEAGAFAVDVEWNGEHRDLARGPDAARVILSHHGAACTSEALSPLFDAMAATPAGLLKIVPSASRVSEIEAVRALLSRAREAGRPLAAFATGRAGVVSRILAPFWGSWATYGSAAGKPTAEGQLAADDLAAVFRVDGISAATTRFALFGTPVGSSPSPAMHAAGYRALGIDAIYVPVDTDDVEDVLRVAPALDLSGFAVTIPLKSAVAARCRSLDQFADCGAVNTVVRGADGWHGFNTDAPAATALLEAVLPLEGASVAIAGTGSTARAIGAALVGGGARVTLHGRDPGKTADAARRIAGDAGTWDALRTSRWDILVQTTPLGARGEDIPRPARFPGRVVLDVVYGAEATPLVRAARAAGLRTIDGRALLIEQALLQFEILTGRAAPREAMTAALMLQLGEPMP